MERGSESNVTLEGDAIFKELSASNGIEETAELGSWGV
jgi:hypothetical protein